MELTRIIHPVGQGGFYTETLKNNNGDEFNVVYDCGGNNKTFMENYLERFIYDSANRRKKKIDAVFISHLHADHTNGLKYLLDKVYPRYLFLPQLTEDMVFEVLFHNTLSGRTNVQEINGLITDLYGQNRDNYVATRIVRVNPIDGESSVDLEGDNNSIDLSAEGISDSVIRSGSKIHFGTPWFYIPYNPPVKPRKAVSFYDFIKTELNISYDFGYSDLPNIVKNIPTKTLRQIYASYFDSNHNAYSMKLFSGLMKPHYYLFECYSGCPFQWHCNCRNYFDCSCCDCRRTCTPNCIYTGDFEAKEYTSNLKEFYNPYGRHYHIFKFHTMVQETIIIQNYMILLLVVLSL